MRYIGILLVILSLPAFIVWLRSDRRNYRYAYFAIGVFPFISSPLNLDASLWDFGGLGYVKGLVVTLLDTLCLAILANTRHTIVRLPFAGLFAAYIIAVMLSILQAPGFFAPFSYAFQLMRVFIVFVTVAAVVQQKDALRYIAYGLAVGAALQGVVTISQRLGGAFQVGGTIGHQNLTGMTLHFATLPLLAMLLAGDRSRLYLAGVAGGLVAVALGASRGSIAFLAVGLALLLALSIMRHATTRKFGVAALSVLMVAAASPVIVAGLDTRMANLGGGSVWAQDGERAAFEKAAGMMWADHPLGVGANRYTFVGITEGYSARAGVTWAGSSRLAVVHNLYYLTAAELGWFGLLTLIPFLLWIIVKGFHFAFKYRRDPRGDLVLGCTCAVTAMVLQSLYEWVFVLPTVQYVFAISLGIISGCILQRKIELAQARREARLAKRHSQPAQPAFAKADAKSMSA